MGSPVKAREWEKSLTVKCRLCGGAKCKRCSESAALAKTDSPVHGLHADWVADRLLGMMRPSSRLMKEYEIAAQFHKLRITAVFNLTLPGEHPYCGDGLGTSGFPYDPETDLMAESIRFYNFGWEDMTTPTLPVMLDIVKVMASILQDGHSKLAVHCHAGYGRTGLAIACCLLFMHNIPPDRAIHIVRRDRPGSIQTSGQAKFVRRFHEYINASKVVFALPLLHDRFTVADMTEQQNRMVHGGQCAGVRLALPRVLDFLCRELDKATELDASASSIHAFASHVLWQGHEGRRTVGDLVEQQSRHGKAVFGESYTSALEITASAVVASPPVGGIVPPPPVPARLPHGGLHYISQDDLFPVKVAFNVGEWNWSEAMTLGSSVTAALAPALVLDWLEHLAEPLLETELVAQVASSSEESALTKWKPLNQQPSVIIRSLDRFLTSLRELLKKANAAQSPTATARLRASSLSDALCVRSAMALFHLTASTPMAMLCKHTDFVKQLVREWHPPKRLELNLESLQLLTKISSTRHLSTSSPSSKHLHQTESGPPSISPTRRALDPTSLEPVALARVHRPATEPASSPKKGKESAELSPLKLSHEVPPPHSPIHPRPPPLELTLPPMPRDKDERQVEPSPTKTDQNTVPRLAIADIRKELEQPPIQHHSLSSAAERDAATPTDQRLTPTPPPPAGPPEPERVPALHSSASTPLHPTTPPPLVRGPGSGGSVYSLPIVKVGDRYKNRIPQ